MHHHLSIENIDPMGVHTGDSITVAPALTLTDKEYQVMRNASIAVLREIGVETGGSNVQFAVNPEDGRLVVIEMNPRVSRSSALASKATGFPIAKIAAKLAVGYTLDELDNDITGVTPASFEPTIDYVVTKIPRFAFEKFPGTEPVLTTAMKSVGEAMAIGRTFKESFRRRCAAGDRPDRSERDGIRRTKRSCARPSRSRHPTACAWSPRPSARPQRGRNLRHHLPSTRGSCASSRKSSLRSKIRSQGLPDDAYALTRLKAMGFSDKRLAELTGKTETGGTRSVMLLDVRPVYKRIDTCAAEFASPTAYMYSTYEHRCWPGKPDCESLPTDRKRS
jgi:carbamoyl-phosphate synthase large subunit